MIRNIKIERLIIDNYKVFSWLGEKNEANVSKQCLFKIIIFILFTERKMINMYQFIKVITFSIFASENDCLELKINRIIHILFLHSLFLHNI